MKVDRYKLNSKFAKPSRFYVKFFADKTFIEILVWRFHFCVPQISVRRTYFGGGCKMYWDEEAVSFLVSHGPLFSSDQGQA